MICICGDKMKEEDGLYLCEECGLLYNESTWAEKCEKWCREHNSCNMEITQHAVSRPGLKLE